MSFLKKLLVFIIIIFALLLLSYSPYDMGKCSFEFMNVRVSAPTNFVLMAFAAIYMGYTIIVSFFKFLRALLKNDDAKAEKESENSLINMLFSDNPYNANKYHVVEKHITLKEAIECYLFWKSKKLPRDLMVITKADEAIVTLKAYKIKLNICKHIHDNHISAAACLVQKIVREHPSYTSVIKEQILQISKNMNLNFEPKKFKYGLSKQFMDEYAAITAMREFNESKNLTILEKACKNYPSNAEIVMNVIQHTPDISDKKIYLLVKQCFQGRPNRILANALLSMQHKENLFETAIQITAPVSNDNIEKLWFLCIIATKAGHISKAVELFKLILTNYSSKQSDIIVFFILNHSEFSSNIELIQLIKERIRNADRDYNFE